MESILDMLANIAGNPLVADDTRERARALRASLAPSPWRVAFDSVFGREAATPGE